MQLQVRFAGAFADRTNRAGDPGGDVKRTVSLGPRKRERPRAHPVRPPRSLRSGRPRSGRGHWIRATILIPVETLTVVVVGRDLGPDHGARRRRLPTRAKAVLLGPSHPENRDVSLSFTVFVVFDGVTSPARAFYKTVPREVRHSPTTTSRFECSLASHHVRLLSTTIFVRLRTRSRP